MAFGLDKNMVIRFGASGFGQQRTLGSGLLLVMGIAGSTTWRMRSTSACALKNLVITFVFFSSMYFRRCQTKLTTFDKGISNLPYQAPSLVSDFQTTFSQAT